MRVLDLFSGIGGFAYGLEQAGGLSPVAFCEQGEFQQTILRKHWPEVPIHDDVRTMQFPECDILTGGFPCQDLSLAGKRAGITGARSGLYREVVRAVRMVRPRWVLLENVAALLGNGMGVVLGDMAQDGYDAEWDCISAHDVGAPHGRDRVWIAFADADQFQRSNGCGQDDGRGQWGAEEAGYADRQWQLQPPRLLGNVRRWADHAAGAGTWWSRDWQAEFAALRRMDDGVPSRLDRAAISKAVAALGNAVVTVIPEIWGRAIMEARA